MLDSLIFVEVKTQNHLYFYYDTLRHEAMADNEVFPSEVCSLYTILDIVLHSWCS